MLWSRLLNKMAWSTKFLENHISVWKLVGWCTVTWSIAKINGHDLFNVIWCWPAEVNLWMLNAFIYINFTGSGWLLLTHWIQWYHKALEILVNLVSGNGLLPDGTKPLPWLLLTNIGHEKLGDENNNIWMVEVVCCFCHNWSSDLNSSQINGWGLGAFLRWYVGGPFNLQWPALGMSE